jgi:peptide subunit release factor 1 (eRF1)
MISRESIRELAQFESPQGCAVSFYFQPFPPRDRSHREEGILVKDLVRNALREAEKNGRNGCARSDLERILDLAERLHGNHARAKAVFACGGKNFWREFDLPPRLARTGLFVNRRFHIKPLASVLEALPRVFIALMDRTKARFFDLWLDEISEREPFLTELPRRGRSDGWAGYDAGHAERKVGNEAMHHFKKVADRLMELSAGEAYDHLLIGCRDEVWSEIEPHLHPYARQRLVGHFHIDPSTATPEETRKETDRLLKEYESRRRQALIREVVGQAHRNNTGAVGLRRVMRSLEAGEIQTMLIGSKFAAPGTECRNCGHLDIKMSKECAACGNENRELTDIADVLISNAIRNGIEVIHVADDPEFEKLGNIAARLRFRGDHNTEKMKQAS